MQKHKFFAAGLPALEAIGLALIFIGNSKLIIAGGALILSSGIAAGLLLYRSTLTKPALNIPIKQPIKRVAELEGLYHTLQDNYYHKTTDLQDKIDDLERFHRLSIGRELRLIELKNELKGLRSTQPVADSEPTGPEPDA